MDDPSCVAFLASKGGDATAAAAEAAGYTGVQDYDDYPGGPPPGDADPLFYDPDDVRVCSQLSNFVHAQVMNVTGGQFSGTTT